MRIVVITVILVFLAMFLNGCSDDSKPVFEHSSAALDEDQVSTTDSGMEKPQSPTPADYSRISLDWPGTYSGVIPCASCPGIETEITLDADGTFQRSMRYIDESPIPVTDQGTFSWNEAGGNITLKPDEGDPQQYKVGEHRLFQLDQQGQRIEGDLGARYILDQHLHDPRIDDRRWLLSELGGRRIEISEDQKQPFLLLRSEQARVHGNAGCNTFNGFYAIKSGQRIEFGDNMAMTLMACPNLELEQQFIEVLQMADNYSIGDDGSMTLNRARMAPLARLSEAGDVE